ncbi:MAG: hypothetical protein M4D80_20255 [Myxococcota bacterium]|nr:hypothetical protein [Deltaproteobacteria bacterium]MDQ3337502.1 hypothetical protein [Myxococcota bacterium]
MKTFRFRPRYGGVAWTSVGIGGALGVVGASIGFIALPMITGALGVAAGVAYLASPTWKLAVTIDDDALSVGSPKRQRFRLPWRDVVKVIVAPEKGACFVDGGKPEQSLLVPGDGAPAPYDIEDRKGLVEAILAHVPAEKVERVTSLADVAKSRPLPT